MERQEQLRPWLALVRTGFGARRINDLIERLGDPAEVLRAGGSLLPAERAEKLRRPDWEGVERDLAWLAAVPDRTILTRADPGYPPQLIELPDAPPVLFLHGRQGLLAEPQIAMVGSRSPSAAGAEIAFEFARHLAGAGLTITSGLALGIDASAHRGALAARGGTIAVLGTGPDRVYPASHRALAHALVAEGGLMVTEFPVGTTPRRDLFPRRNRIIAGLSLGTLVVEAALHSGSLITARLAGEQGREVFAIPGSIHNPLARGCHKLIREGAKLVETAQDILLELAPQLRPLLLPPADPAAPAAGPPLPEGAGRLLSALGHAPASIDTLVERSGLTPETVSSILLLLELGGYVASTGGRFSRTGKRIGDEAERI